MDTKMIYHYTTITGLAGILKSQCIRFTRIDFLNDMEEGYINNSNFFRSHCYVSCWINESEESIPLWSSYSNNFRGVRLAMSSGLFDNACKNSWAEGILSLSGDSHIDTMKINVFPSDPWFGKPRILHSGAVLVPFNYSNNIESPSFQMANFFLHGPDPVQYGMSIDDYDVEKYGLIKSQAWKYENELRYRLLCDHSYGYMKNTYGNYNKYIDYPINSDAWDSSRVTVGPLCTSEDNYILESLLNRFQIERKKQVKMELSQLQIR